METIVNLVILIVMFGLMTSVQPALSGLALALMIASSAVVGFLRMSIARMGMIAGINYVWWITSGFLSGGLILADFLEPSFYSGEGRIFLAYVPAVFFGVVTATERNSLFLLRLLLAVASLLGALAVLYQLGALPSGLLSERGHLRLLFSSHHSAGAFGASMLIVVLVTFVERPDLRRWLGLTVLGLLVFMISVNSRTSLVGLFAVLGWVYLSNLRSFSISKVRYILAGLLLVATLPALAALANESFAKRLEQLFDASVWDNAVAQIELTERMGDLSLADKILASQEGGNILSRVRLWSFATERFLRSPLIGIGFGRWNDESLRYNGFDGVVVLATDAFWRSNSVSTAHSSYFHMLAETGIVGLGLILGLWVALYRRVSLFRSIDPPGSSGSIVAGSARLVIIFVIFSGLTNHAFASPSYTLLALTLAGVIVARKDDAGESRDDQIASEPR